MLAKIWKKLLLVVCIIACLFNITYKIVNKTSLKSELQSIVGGEGLSTILKNMSNELEKNSNLFTTNIKDNLNVQKEKQNNENAFEVNENKGTEQPNQEQQKYVVVYN